MMGFVCTLTGNSFDVEVAQRGSSRVAIVRIGVDDEDDTIYSAMVCLEPGGGGDVELIFCILAADAYADEEPTTFWSGKATSHIIQGLDRGSVLSVILVCVANLVKMTQPSRIYMCTHDANLPQPALLKHNRVAQTVEACGYKVSHPNSFHGQHIWYMDRIG
ncbi:hypothetical protein ACT6QG_12035 [Xanthobacter sp. TB0136]|uniref:hypothetical protein n=1 Tax=Xanthobacter sp. TB0136 TaxID=3459177 RepID=UPI004039BFFC